MEIHKQKVIDLEFGFNKEKEVLPILNDFFDVNLKQNDRYDIFDFVDEDKKMIFELKSRRCKKHDYKDRGGIMIGANKVREGFRKIRKGYRVIFTWLFTNKYCYYELTKVLDKDINIKNNVMARSDRGGEEFSSIAYIPTKKLKNILIL